MLSFSDNIDQIIKNAMEQFSSNGKQDEPQALTIMIQASKFYFKMYLPPLLLEVAMMNSDEATVAILLGWDILDISETDLESVLSQLLSMEDLLEESDEENDKENDDE